MEGSERKPPLSGVRFRVEVSWDKDACPGWNHQADDVVKMIEEELQRIDHYHPEVKVLEPESLFFEPQN